jgi:hypothetical protein
MIGTARRLQWTQSVQLGPYDAEHRNELSKCDYMGAERRNESEILRLVAGCGI